MRSIADALSTVAATLWAGGLWITGYAVAPVLFATLTDRTLAGLVAGKLFSLMAFVGMACAAVLIAVRLLRARGGVFREPVWWVVVAMLALTLAGEFGAQPVMADLKVQALPAPVMESAFRDRFALWHGVASVLYLIESLLGATLVIQLRNNNR